MAATLAIPVAVAVVVRCMQVDDPEGDWPVGVREPPRGAPTEPAAG
jgi:hypothetical protein